MGLLACVVGKNQRRFPSLKGKIYLGHCKDECYTRRNREMKTTASRPRHSLPGLEDITREARLTRNLLVIVIHSLINITMGSTNEQKKAKAFTFCQKSRYLPCSKVLCFLKCISALVHHHYNPMFVKTKLT